MRLAAFAVSARIDQNKLPSSATKCVNVSGSPPKLPSVKDEVKQDQWCAFAHDFIGDVDIGTSRSFGHCRVSLRPQESGSAIKELSSAQQRKLTYSIVTT